MALYFDHNATTKPLHDVCEAVAAAMNEHWANPSSNSVIGKEAKRKLNHARQQISKAINAEYAEEIIFTSGGTESNHTVLYTFSGLDSISKMPHIIAASFEHPSILAPLKHLEELNCVELSLVSAKHSSGTNMGLIDPQDVFDCIRSNTVLVTVMLAQNETGNVQPIAKIVDMVRKKEKECGYGRIFVHTDAAQAIGKIGVNVNSLNVDYLTMAGHKFYGPRIGALFVRKGCPISPIFRGGGQESGIRAGTENVPMCVGLGLAAENAMKSIENGLENGLNELRMHLFELLKNSISPNISVKSNTNLAAEKSLPNTLNISITGDIGNITGADLIKKCENTVIFSSGAACHSGDSARAQPQQSSALVESGVAPVDTQCVLRLSIGVSTSREEVECAVKCICDGLRGLVS